MRHDSLPFRIDFSFVGDHKHRCDCFSTATAEMFEYHPCAKYAKLQKNCMRDLSIGQIKLI